MLRNGLERYKRMVQAAEYKETSVLNQIASINEQINGKKEGINALKNYIREMSSPKKKLFPGELQNRASFLSKVNNAILQEQKFIKQLHKDIDGLEADKNEAKRMVLATRKTLEIKVKEFKRFREAQEQSEIDQYYASRF